MFKRTKKFLALLLTVMILVGTLPIMSFAAKQGGQVRVIVENTTFTSEVNGKEPAWTGQLVDTWVNIDNASTMMSAVVDALNEGGYTQEGAENNYISSINGLAQFDGGSGSGWMGTLNDWFTNEGFDAFTVAAGTLSEGDEIRILYTQDYGADLGGTWENNNKTVKALSFSAGELSPSFDKDTHDYTLTLAEGTEGVVVKPTASNKNFQVRTSVGEKEYKRSAMVPVKNGTVITVKCGDPAWPSMNGGSHGDADSVPAETYIITVKLEAPAEEEDAPYLSNLKGNNMTFADVFDPDVHEYTVVTPSNTSSIAVYAYLSDDAPEGSVVTASYTNTSGVAQKLMFNYYDYFNPPYHYRSLSGLIANGTLEGNSFTLTVGTETDFQTYTFHIVREPRITQVVFYDMAETTLKTIRLNATTSADVEFLPVGAVKMKATGNPTSATILVNDKTKMASGDTIEITPMWGEDKTATIKLDVPVDVPAVSNSYTLVCYQEPESIRIATPPTKTVYEPGDIFDPTGLVVEAVYADDTATTINNYTIQSVGLLPSVTGVTISYGSKTVLQPITVGGFSFPGTGTETDPYRLSTTEHMKALSTAVSGGITFTGSYFVMENDITLPEEWTPVGTSLANSFKGTFDGQNNTINVPEGGLPLFGYVVGPTIKNLNIFGTKIAGYGLINNYVVGAGNPTIDNVTLKSGSSTLQSGFIGGFASGMNSITIKNSTVEEGVVIGYDKKQSKIGSFGGDFNGSIDNCVSYATVYGVNKVGGILASKGQSMGMCKVTKSKFHGTIVATGNYVGGIIGSGYEAGSAPNSPCVTIQDCVSNGSITGGNNVGGILGGEPGINQCWSNGIGYIQDNEFSGTISSKGSYVGGIIGRLDSLNRYNIIENNIYTKDCGATKGIGYVAMVDTSCETVDTSDESVVYINTAKELPKISGVIYKDHNRTDDPLGEDAYKLTQMLTDEKENTAPARKTGVAATATASLSLGEEYKLDLSDIFEDADGDELTYKVSIDGEADVPANEAYTFNSKSPGTYTLVFKANDGTEDSTDTYTVTLAKVAQLGFTVETIPADAIVKVYDQAGAEVKAKVDGSYGGLFGTYDYTYTVAKYGYVAQSGVVPKTGGHLRVTLNKAADSGLEDVSAYWKNFRGSDSNMAITDVKLPIDEENINLKWHGKLGTGWSAAPSIQIIVDNSLIVMAGTSIYKLDLKTGETLATGTMVAAPNFGYTPPTYAEGMIFAPLTGGIIQTFNAKTLESLWVYRDNLGGQSLSPITYDSGYIYTGFWNGETRDANFVCLSVTDEDVTKTDEAKTATWKHTQAGGFYWAGAVVVGDAVIVGTDDGTSGYTGTSKLYSFNKFTGEVISSLNLSGDQRSSIAYDKASGKIYLTTKSGYLYSAKVNATTGVLSGLKGVNYNAQSTSTPVVYKGKVYFGTGSGISTTGSSGNLVVADANSLEMLYAIGLKGYPQCSMLLTTAYEDETGYIYLYSTYNALPGGISMIQVDPNATTAAGAKLIELYDAAGFSQFCISSIINGPDGTLYYKNDSANVLAVGIPEAAGVIKLISAIGTVTADSGDGITIARNAYDALSEEQRIKVSNYSTLTAAEAAYKKITDRIDGVEKQIGNIGTIKYDDATKKKIDAARAAYDKLSLGEKKYVTNYSMLTDAEAQYDRLKNAQKVMDLIDAIGEVTGKSEKDIKAARKAYNALSSAERSLVTNYFTLTAAERKFEALDSKTGAEEEAKDNAKTEAKDEAKDKAKTEAKDEAKAEGKTKVIGDGDTKAVIDGITYMVDTEAATLMKSISRLVKVEDPDKQGIIDAYKIYVAMNEKLKAQVFNYGDLEALTNKLGVKNHRDEAAGMEVEGLDWYIQLMVEEVASGQTYDMLAGSIGNNTLIRLWDIKFINLLTEEAFEPGMSIRIRVKASDLREFEQMRVAHLMDDGRVEYYDCELEDGYVIWEGDSFSFYALIGGMGEAANILEEVEDTEAVIAIPQEDVVASPEPSLTWIWILIGCLGATGIIALITVILMKRKKE